DFSRLDLALSPTQFAGEFLDIWFLKLSDEDDLAGSREREVDLGLGDLGIWLFSRVRVPTLSDSARELPGNRLSRFGARRLERSLEGPGHGKVELGVLGRSLGAGQKSAA